MFQKTKFSLIKYLSLPNYTKSRFPLYSPEFVSFIEKNSRLNAIEIKENKIHKSLKFSVIEGFSNNFKERIGKSSENLLSLYEDLISDFVEWDTKMITKWEKEIQFLDFYKRGREDHQISNE